MKQLALLPLAALAAGALILGRAPIHPALALPVAQAGPPPTQPIPGLEVLVRDSLHLVRGKRVGLITNHTAVTRSGRHAVDLLHATPGVRLTALYAPEHGIRGTVDGGEHIAAGRDARTGVPILSLYGR